MKVALLALFALTILARLGHSEGQQKSAAKLNSTERSWIDRILPARQTNSSKVGDQPVSEAPKPADEPAGDGAKRNNRSNPDEAAEAAKDGQVGNEEDDADQDAAEEVDDDDDDDEDEDDDKGASSARAVQAKMLTDLFGNQLKLEGNRTLLLSPAKGRDLGMLTLKAILLGPIIGLTIKAALVRGIFWAIGAYVLHLFFPGLLGALGLGSGLVGFARQMSKPSYAHLLVPHLLGLQSALPRTFTRLASQYRQVYQPVVESIQSIPEGHCRLRAVCETGSYLIRNSQHLSTSLQRLSATVYLNFGTDYSKAWLDGIVQGDCAAKYAQCQTSPFSMLAARLAEALQAPRAAAEAAQSAGQV